MPKGLPVAAKDNVAKCQAATIAAVDTYNRPGPRFRTAYYIVLIVIAWTSGRPLRQLIAVRQPWRNANGSGIHNSVITRNGRLGRPSTRMKPRRMIQSKAAERDIMNQTGRRMPGSFENGKGR